jgi:hypothetical protein
VRYRSLVPYVSMAVITTTTRRFYGRCPPCDWTSRKVKTEAAADVLLAAHKARHDAKAKRRGKP